MLEIRNLFIQYKKENVLNHCSVTFNCGKVYAISGPSGCGKSSLLQVLSLLQKQNYDYFSIGEYEIDAKNMQLIRKKGIGYVFQEKNQFDYFTLYENLKLFAYIAGKELSIEEAVHLLELVHLNVPYTQLAGTLSGGEKQKLAIACSLVKDTKIIVCDEVTSGLDHTNEEIIMDLLLKLAHQYNKCIIIATHSNYIKTHADQVLSIENKHLEYVEENKEEQLNLEMKHLDHSFYSFFLSSSPLIKNKLILLLTSLLAGMIAIFVSCNLIQNYLVDYNDQALNRLTISDIKLTGKEDMNSKDIEYYSKINHIIHCDYYFDLVEDGVHLHALLDYSSNQLKQNEIIITPSLANNDQLEVGDSYYIYLFDETFTIHSILDSQEDAFGSLEEYHIYLSKDYFNSLPTNKLLIHIDSYANMEGVIKLIEDYKKDEVLVSSANNKYMTFSAIQTTTVSLIQSIIQAMLVIVCGLMIYIEYVLFKQHRFEFALLKANGLSTKELNLLLVVRTAILTFILILGSFIFNIIINSILLFNKVLTQLISISSCLEILGLCIVIMAIPLLLAIIELALIEPNILLKG